MTRLQTFTYGIVARVLKFTYGIKNIYRWRKVLYADRDFDYYFIYEILKTKLQFQADHLDKYHKYATFKNDVKVIRKCIDLIEEVQGEYYLDLACENNDDNLQEKHDKARVELFTMLSDNIEKWWD